MKRIWNVRLNVDEWNSGIAGLDDDADRIRFLAGFNAGLNGKETMSKGQAWEAGWKVGNSSHLEAIKFSDLQRSRVMNRYHGTTAVEPGNNHGTTPELPIYNLQSTIEVTTNDKPTIHKIFSEAIAPGPKPPRKTPESIGPEIATSDGPWRITVAVALKRMSAYGMTEAQLIDLLGRVAKHNASLPAGKLPGAAAMQSILHAWFAKHSPGCAATELPIRAPKLSPDTLAACIEAQAMLDEQRRAERKTA